MLKLKVYLKKLSARYMSSRRSIFSFLLGAFVTAVLTLIVNVSSTYLEYVYFLDIPRPFSLEQSYQYYPIGKGNKWVYSGIAEMQTANSGEDIVTKKFDDYTFTVTEAVENKGLLGARVLVENDPINSLEGTLEAREELWLMKGGELYVVREAEKLEQYWKEIQNEQYYIDSDILHSLKWTFPLYKGKQLGGYSGLRSDDAYAYLITDEKKISSSTIGQKECFKRVSDTLPDYEESWFCLGIGLVEYSYTHRGSVLNIWFTLSDYYIK